MMKLKREWTKKMCTIHFTYWIILCICIVTRNSCTDSSQCYFLLKKQVKNVMQHTFQDISFCNMHHCQNLQGTIWSNCGHLAVTCTIGVEDSHLGTDMFSVRSVMDPNWSWRHASSTLVWGSPNSHVMCDHLGCHNTAAFVAPLFAGHCALCGWLAFTWCYISCPTVATSLLQH